MILSTNLSLLLSSFSLLSLASAIPASNLMPPSSQELTNAIAITNESAVPSFQSVWSLPGKSPPTNINSLDDGTHNLTFTPPGCNGPRYGRNLQESSCFQAFATIPTDTRRLRFGARNLGKWNINLPYRFLSRELLWLVAKLDCAIHADTSESGQQRTVFALSKFRNPWESSGWTRQVSKLLRQREQFSRYALVIIDMKAVVLMP